MTQHIFTPLLKDKLIMGNITPISQSIIPELVHLSDEDLKSLRIHGFTTVEDVATLKKESIDNIFGIDPSTEVKRSNLLYVSKHLKRGGVLRKDLIKPIRTTMRISESIIPRLINFSSPNHIVTSLQNKGFTTVEDVKRLNNESISKVFGTDNANAVLRTRLLYIVKYLRRGGILKDGLTMREIGNFVQKVDQRNNQRKKYLKCLFCAFVRGFIGESVDQFSEGFFEGVVDPESLLDNVETVVGDVLEGYDELEETNDDNYSDETRPINNAITSSNQKGVAPNNNDSVSTFRVPQAHQAVTPTRSTGTTKVGNDNVSLVSGGASTVTMATIQTLHEETNQKLVKLGQEINAMNMKFDQLCAILQKVDNSSSSPALQKALPHIRLANLM